MSIYTKLNTSRTQFHKLSLKKSGLNKFAGYQYFELADFLIPAMDILSKNELCAFISFGKELATMKIVDVTDNTFIEITSPMSTAALKGCHEVQQLGAVQSYLRRYLWVSAMEIVEHDAIDGSQPVEERKTPDVAAILKGISASTTVDLLKSNFEHAMMMLDSVNHPALKQAKTARYRELTATKETI